jgi:hypothetical protein
MKAIVGNPKNSAITGLLLALPFITLILLFTFGIEPDLGPLDPYLDPENSHIGSFTVFGALLLSLAGFAISVIPVVQSMQAGNGITAHPINLLLASIILFFILAFAGLIIVDQYPCWVGGPNCD